MIMKALRSIFFIACTIIFPTCLAQNVAVSFAYDESGNRISRSIVIAKVEQNNKSATSEEFAEDSSLVADNADKIRIAVYPNPTDDRFTVALSEPDGKVYHIALYNTTGVLMEERRVRAHSNLEFDLKGKPSGTYLLHIVSDGMSQTWKVVKR